MPRIDILHAFRTAPPPQDFILPGFLAGTVGALVAPGSAGKSMLAFQIACAVASEKANTTGLSIERHGRVLYLNLEDPSSEIERRLYALGSRFDMLTQEEIAKNLVVSDRMGVSTDLMCEEFILKLLAAAEGTRLVIIDTISRAHRLNENDNGDMAQLVARLESVVRQTGAGLLYLHHASKAAVLSGQGNLAQAARGASALIDNARWCGNLMKMTEEEAKTLKSAGRTIGEERRGFFVKYEIGKQNYGQIQQSQWYERTEGGILKPVNLSETRSGGEKNNSRRRNDI